MHALLLLVALPTLIWGKKFPTACFREGEIALTFDQGPSYYTGILLNVLKKENVKAAFHVTPDYLDNPVIMAYLRRAGQDGHIVGLYVIEGAMENEGTAMAYIRKMSHKLQPYLEQPIKFVRFAHPGPPASVLDAVQKEGFIVTGYNLDSVDYSFKGISTDEAAERVSNLFKVMLDSIVAPAKGSFVTIQRDLLDFSVAATEKFIKYAKQKGYSFVRLDSCIAGRDRKVKKLDDVGNGLPSDDGNGTMDESLGTLQCTISLMVACLSIGGFLLMFV